LCFNKKTNSKNQIGLYSGGAKFVFLFVKKIGANGTKKDDMEDFLVQFCTSMRDFGHLHRFFLYSGSATEITQFGIFFSYQTTQSELTIVIN